MISKSVDDYATICLINTRKSLTKNVILLKGNSRVPDTVALSKPSQHPNSDVDEKERLSYHVVSVTPSVFGVYK